MCQSSEHVNVNLFENMAFANIIKGLEWRSFWIIQIGTKSNERYPYKRHPKKRQRKKEGDMKTGAEIGMLLTTKKKKKNT